LLIQQKKQQVAQEVLKVTTAKGMTPHVTPTEQEERRRRAIALLKAMKKD